MSDYAKSVKNRKLEILDAMIAGLESQGWQKSVKINELGEQKCLYRTEDGKKCAVGWLIVTKLIEKKNMLQAYNDWGIIFFLDSCQGAHDNSDGPEDMKNYFLGLRELLSIQI